MVCWGMAGQKEKLVHFALLCHNGSVQRKALRTDSTDEPYSQIGLLMGLVGLSDHNPSTGLAQLVVGGSDWAATDMT